MKAKRWLWALAALPVIVLPLIAGESRPEPPAASATPAPGNADAAEAPEAASPQQPEPADERISADNSLSYPVDI